MLSSEPGAESPPKVKIGSSIVIVVELTVVVAPLTTKFPLTVKLSSTVTVPPAESIVRLPDAVSISLSPVTPTRIPFFVLAKNTPTKAYLDAG